MKTYLLIAALTTGGFAVVGPLSSDTIPATIDDAERHFDSHADLDDLNLDHGLVAIEIADGASYVVPTEDHDDDVLVLGLRSSVEGAGLFDLAGVQRTAAGRVVDAHPGSMDAALSGMQHDAGGTVRNTVSPEPTPSPVVQEALAAQPDLREQEAPKAQQPLEAQADDAG